MQVDSSTLPIEALLDEVREPISPANPCGDDVTYDETFQRVKAVIDMGSSAGGRIDHEKLVEGEGGSISEQTDGANYAAMIEDCRVILREKSKDLRVAAYLAVGLLEVKGIVGVAEGLRIVETLVDTYWEDLYPSKKRARARKGAFELFIRRYADTLESYKPVAGDRTSLEGALAAVDKLLSFLPGAMQEDAPVLSGLKARLSERLRQLPEAVEQKPSEPSVFRKAVGDFLDRVVKPAEPRSAPAPDSETPAEMPAAAAEIRSPNEALRELLRLSSYLNEQDKTNPTPYRLSRMVRWDGIIQEPAHENGRTRMEGPPAQRKTYLTGLLERGQYALLIDEAESTFQELPFHFWLDLQRLMVTAMEALGEPYAATRKAILIETALLINRVPKLTALTYSDGTAFSDPLTSDWIETDVKGVFAGTDARSSSAGGPVDTDSRLLDLYEEARKQLGTGDLSGSLAKMQDGAGQDTSARDRFMRRLYTALLCMRGGQPVIARPILESLDQEVSRHALEVWDPAVALEVWTSLYRCYEALAPTMLGNDQVLLRNSATTTFEKICRLDARLALTL